MHQDHLGPLSDKIRQTAFVDAKNSANDASLLGPPTLEFAPYNRTPGGKRRNDARQGLIDQDPEFIEFLESLTNPVTKASPPESEASRVKNCAVTVTPLIQHLRDKKAAKDKASPATASKSGRETLKAETTKAKPEEKTVASQPKATLQSIEKKATRGGKVDKNGKDGVKAPKKGASTAAVPVSPAVKPAPEAPKQIVPNVERRPVAPAAAAARMLQRDLGLQPRGGGAARRGGRAAPEAKKSSGQTQNGNPVAKASIPVQPTSASGQSLSTTPPVETAKENSKPGPPTAPRADSSKQLPIASPVPKSNVLPAVSVAHNQKPAAPRTQAAVLSSSSATEAFLKHANPSQGVTEPLIEDAMKIFGTVVKVEIDKRKGFAYVEFANSEGLQKAIAASPVKVAQSQVQVLERKDRTSSRAVQTPLVQARVPASTPTTPRGASAINDTAPPSFKGGGRGGRGRNGATRGGTTGINSSGPATSTASANVQSQSTSSSTSATTTAVALTQPETRADAA